MASPPVHRIDLRAFRYATEVPERVEAALAVVIPELTDAETGPDLTRTRSEGHYGHPIDVYEASLEDDRAMASLFDRLADGDALERIVADLDDRVTEDCEMFIRLDKQRAYAEDRLHLGDGIEVRIKLEAYPATPDRAIANLTAYLTERGLLG